VFIIFVTQITNESDEMTNVFLSLRKLRNIPLVFLY